MNGRTTVMAMQSTEKTAEKATRGTPKYCETGVMKMPKHVRIMAHGKNMMTIQVATMAYAYLVPSRRCSTEAPLFLARNSVGDVP